MYSCYNKLFIIGLALLTMAPRAKAVEKTGFEVYGFAQVDYNQDFKRVNPNSKDVLRPSRIPVPEGVYGSDGQASLSAKQSKIGMQSWLPIEGSTLYTKIDFDFFGLGVDEGQTTIHLLNAYGQWGNWLGGQTNSLFMDGDEFPNVVDYWGPAGMVFVRNPQIRWTPIQGDMSFAMALEKPSDDLEASVSATLDPGATLDIQPDEKVPDLTAQWRMSGGWGYFQLGGVVRSIGYESLTSADNEPSDQITGWGINATTNIKFMEKDRLILGVVSGEGIASYMNDGGNDLAMDGTLAAPEAKALPLLGITAYYDHAWNDKWTSSIGFSQIEVQNTDLQGATAFNRGQYASFNILATPQKNILAGAEFLWGNRKNNDDTDNDDSRIQVTMRYSFSSKD